MIQLRVVLADDHPQILTLLRSLLEPEYRVVGTAENGRSLVATVLAFEPDFVLTDLDMPIMNGIDATRELHRIYPDLCVIVHSSHTEPDLIAAAYKAGAAGYVIKGSTESLVSSLRTVVGHVRKPLNTATSLYRRLETPMPSPYQNV
jgi:DNA-binding NarL/FixJ family response regulator